MKMISKNTLNKSNTRLIFTPDEKKILINNSEYLEEDINNTLQAWSTFLENVEKGYELTIDDYTNDIYKRNLLKEGIEKLPRMLKDKIINYILPLDKKFKQITNNIEVPLWSEENPKWWWYRIPKKLVGELKKDVQSL